jgi:hypothetical protein
MKRVLYRIYDGLSEIHISTKYFALIIPMVIIILLYQNSRITNLNSDLVLMEDGLNETQREYIVLYNRFLNLTSYYNRIISNNIRLNSDIADLEGELVILNVEFNMLRDENNGLIDDFEVAQLQYLDLLSNYSSLVLEKEYFQSELYEILNFKKVFPLENGRIIELQSDGDITLVYNFSYAGYLEINFTSSNDVYFWVGSSIDNEYYSRYPLWPDVARSGSVRLPICKDVILYAKNPNDEDITINLTLRIIY